MEAVEVIMTVIRQADHTIVCLLVVTMEIPEALDMTETPSVDLEVLGTRSPHRKCVHDITF